jgi:hypothetical protein
MLVVVEVVALPTLVVGLEVLVVQVGVVLVVQAEVDKRQEVQTQVVVVVALGIVVLLEEQVAQV